MSTNNGLTLEQKATNFETMKHIRLVSRFLNIVIRELLDRVDVHDDSKLESPEVELFTEYTDRLAKLTYGSVEYEECRKAMGPALAHHYARCRHHPEHHKNGINDMNLVDLLEMFCDWRASSTRHNDGNIKKSIEHNANRFGMSPQLVKIFENSIDLLE